MDPNQQNNQENYQNQQPEPQQPALNQQPINPSTTPPVASNLPVPQKKRISTSKMIGIIVAVFVLLSAVGAAAYFLINASQKEEPPQTSAPDNTISMSDASDQASFEEFESSNGFTFKVPTGGFREDGQPSSSITEDVTYTYTSNGGADDKGVMIIRLTVAEPDFPTPALAVNSVVNTNLGDKKSLDDFKELENQPTTVEGSPSAYQATVTYKPESGGGLVTQTHIFKAFYLEKEKKVALIQVAYYDNAPKSWETDVDTILSSISLE